MTTTTIAAMLALVIALGCSDNSPTVISSNSIRPTPGTDSVAVATVSVSLASTSLFTGTSTLATATLRDAAGNEVSGPSIGWSSTNELVAAVSASGVVSAVGAGTAAIVATSQGRSGAASVTVTQRDAAASNAAYVPPDIVGANFDDSTGGRFFNQIPASLTFPTDPTNSGRGRVAQIRYAGVGPHQDINKPLEYAPPTSLGLGSTFYFGGDLYFPNGTVNFTNGAVQRKLLYFRTIAGPMDMFFVTHLWGNTMQIEWSQDGGDAVSPAVTMLSTGQWYRLETQITMNSAMSTSDGIIRVWVNGALVYENTHVRFTNPGWTSTPFWQVWWVGQQREGIDTCGCGAAEPSIDEVRYWDNVGFSSKRIGASPNGS